MSCNLKSRTIYHADNLDILRGINSNSIDLIYLDPPFNKNDTFIGSNERINEIKKWFQKRQVEYKEFTNVNFDKVFADKPSFDDVWKENDLSDFYYTQIDNYNNKLIDYLESIRNFCVKSGFYYLMYMIPRLIEMHRILKDTGSIYYHCDPTFSHYIKCILDRIFDVSNFRNEIAWCYSGGGTPKKDYPRKKDIILRYSKTNQYIFNIEYKPYGKHNKTGERATDLDGKRKKEYRKEGTPFNDWWIDIRPIINWNTERLGYPTQKPLALLERIIKASSNENDIVLDPFCGCATTCVASQELNREWIGIDISEKAFYMVYYRLKTKVKNTQTEEIQQNKKYQNSQKIMFNKEVYMETKKPYRTDISEKEQKEEEVNFLAFQQDKKEIKMQNKKMTSEEKELYKELLYEEQKGFCMGCSKFLSKHELTIDHIIPQSKGGGDNYENLQLLCYRCNNWKRAKTMLELIEILYNENVIDNHLYKAKLEDYKNGKKTQRDNKTNSKKR